MVLPLAVTAIVLFRLSAHREDGRGLLATLFEGKFHVLRPDLYTDEGQFLLRWLWAMVIVTPLWWILMMTLVIR